MNKKLFAVLIAAVMLFGTTGTVGAVNPTAPATGIPTYNGDSNFGLGGPTDLTIADEDKVIEMLKNEGKIDPNASYEEAQMVYLQFMQDAAKANKDQQPSKLDRELKAKQNQRVQKYQFDSRTTDNNPKKVNILVLLVDYSDYKHSSIQPSETSMYYKDYSHQHYQDMIFGDNGYVGPNGENLISMKQYYAQQSGGSLDIEGTVAGWYTLPKTAAYYGARNGGSNDIRPRNAVADALKEAAKDSSLNLADFDKEDIYDLDGDGDFNEPDGIIDYLMVLHAGVGEEAGGGSLGGNAIWSHSWDLGGVYPIPGTTPTVDYFGANTMYAYHYTIEPEDGATGVFAHEFGHNLGLPDEYDTQYTSSAGEPISMWSVMSSGSWGGTIQGTEPTGFSPYAKQMFQALYDGNWQKQITLDYNSLTSAGARVTLRQADEEGQAVRINLPGKEKDLGLEPFNGSYSYWSGKGNDIDNSMYTTVDVPSAADVKLTFKTWYQIEQDWDYASVIIREAGSENWETLAGDITTTTSPNGQNPGNGITGVSAGWVDGNFDLSAYAGKQIELGFNYWTDGAEAPMGFLVDDIAITADGSKVWSDSGEANDVFTYDGFIKTDGTYTTPHYYLIEWRNHHGVDTGLAHISVLGQNLAYDPGMVVWYVDDSYGDNWTGVHPGEGYLGVVDADQHSVIWQWADGSAPILASGRYQMHDAAFSKDKESALTINTDAALGRSPVDSYSFTEPNFNDGDNYVDIEIPALGRNIPNYGLSIQIANQAKDNSSATIIIKK